MNQPSTTQKALSVPWPVLLKQQDVCQMYLLGLIISKFYWSSEHISSGEQTTTWFIGKNVCCSYLFFLSIFTGRFMSAICTIFQPFFVDTVSQVSLSRARQIFEFPWTIWGTPFQKTISPRRRPKSPSFISFHNSVTHIIFCSEYPLKNHDGALG